MTKQFVFDTNTIISAHLLQHSLSRKAYDMAFEKGLVLRSEETMEELSVTFVRPKFDKYISLETRLAAINEFENRSFLIQITETVKVCRDHRDDKFLSPALSAKASCIVTGDNDLLALHPFRNISIINSSDFLNNPPVA